MVFTELGAVAELERSLIAERVRAGLRNAVARGKRLGRPRVKLGAARMAVLRSQGHSMREIAAELGVSAGLVHKTEIAGQFASDRKGLAALFFCSRIKCFRNTFIYFFGRDSGGMRPATR